MKTEVANGYAEALAFAGLDESDIGKGKRGLTRIARETIEADCNRLLSTVMPDGRFARQWIDELATLQPSYGEGVRDDRRAGHMVYYAANGHGVTWGDDYGSGYATNLCEGLQEACKALSERHPYVERGWIKLA